MNQRGYLLQELLIAITLALSVVGAAFMVQAFVIQQTQLLTTDTRWEQEKQTLDQMICLLLKEGIEYKYQLDVTNNAITLDGDKTCYINWQSTKKVLSNKNGSWHLVALQDLVFTYANNRLEVLIIGEYECTLYYHYGG